MFKYYSPIGFLCHFDKSTIILDLNWNINSENNFKFDIHSLKKNETNIIIMNHHPGNIEFFSKNVLPFIEYKFIIIGFYGDSTFPIECNGWSTNEQLKRGNNFEAIINNKFFSHWFSINKIIPDDDKFTSIPYGLDYWKLLNSNTFDFHCQKITIKNQDDILSNITNKSLHFSKRIPKIFANWHLNITDNRHGNYRIHLQSIIPNNIIYYDSGRSIYSYWEECVKYAFVISPHGNGLDCIRTWESLCLGCIVIVKTSAIDNLYQDLPVLIVNEWNDINDELLNKTIYEFSNRSFNMEKLTMNYWIDKINYYIN
jgi:hypothetical protein